MVWLTVHHSIFCIAIAIAIAPVSGLLPSLIVMTLPQQLDASRSDNQQEW